MFVQITNTPRDYAWGSERAITDLLGLEPTGKPEAELWLGAHPGSPSVIEHPEQVGGSRTLTEWLASEPERASGAHAGQLPYLLKILAADKPLSLQAHPTLAMARAGFDRENAAGLAADAPNRNYKDALHKPEVIYALSDTFDALCGFRSVDEIRAVIAELAAADARAAVSEPELLAALASQLRGHTAEALRTSVEWLLSGSEQVSALVAQVTALVNDDPQLAASAPDAAGSTPATAGPFADALATVRALAAEYPGDPGVVLSLLLNRVTLKRGEALFLPAGNIHAYLKGLGVELMAASDNVLRGGLTPKYIDVPELLHVLQFASLPVPYLEPEHPAPGVEVFQPDVIDFVLVRLALGEMSGDPADAVTTASYSPLGPAIVICTAGSLTVASATGEAVVSRGDSFYITPDEGPLTVSGSGELFLAAPGAAA
ncbi:mannose-6-phosphate isomerase, class I [Subtercola endophyticus]|uniref:mannose-6-phosphate isomerase, class I n=1 Tax=Subtercola endophyticus TaxID=2895559 RepID=UPI001E3BCBF6|nr:mannose-6-phosphate isomerase, class I [Subtercola endophyticus]UFS57733.1 mannose-6-phosphate isomerase, class I [Subtercola endophyticus]